MTLCHTELTGKRLGDDSKMIAENVRKNAKSKIKQKVLKSDNV